MFPQQVTQFEESLMPTPHTKQILTEFSRTIPLKPHSLFFSQKACVCPTSHMTHPPCPQIWINTLPAELLLILLLHHAVFGLTPDHLLKASSDLSPAPAHREPT